jgi:NADPH:quinone reductase-like Zn-dependent oxidoreductase
MKLSFKIGKREMAQRKARSVRIHQFGGPEVLRIEDVIVGMPGLGEVRLNIRAIGLNRTEITLRSGRSPSKPSLPTSIGWEAAGVIDEVGEGVDGWRPGDRVALVPAYSAAQYALYSDVANVPSRSLVAVPNSQTFEQAAATWAAFGTAWAGLISLGNLKAGQTVLISAASSSVGLAAIQTAIRAGARPIALTRTSQKSDELRAHGAAAVLAVEEVDVVQQVKELTGGTGAELVFDPVGGAGFSKLAEATATGGTLILYGALSAEPAVMPPFQVFARDLTIRGFAFPAVVRNDEPLEAVKRFVSEGISSHALVPAIAHTFTLGEIVEAHRFLESGNQVGKAVVSV